MSDLRIVQGNTFATSMEINAVDVSGEPVADFDLQQCTDIQPYYRYRGREIDVEDWTTDDQSVVIVWDGTALGLGDYDVFIRGKFGDTDWRTADSLVFEIVRFGWEANIPEGTTVLDGTYFTEATFSLITEISTSGGGTPSSTTPLMDGEASVGTETAYARGDHRHPTDTSRQAVISDLAAIRSGASAGASAYQKPAGGIPKSDLSSGVQTSLGLADSALQSYTETDPVFEASPAAGITAEDITSWDNKSDFSGSYNDLTNKPTIPAAQIQSDWSQADTTAKDYIKNKPTIPAAQVQSDWNEADNTKADYIKNKPTIPSVVDSLSSSSTTSALSANQGKALNDGKQDKIDASHKLDYSLLDNTPTIPAAQVNSDWNANSGVAQILNKPTIPAAGIPAGGNAGQVLTKTDGSTDYAVDWRDTNNIFTSAYCTTAAATAAKNASCTFWTATANSYLHILITKANSNQGALTLNVNSTGAAPIYINGTVSSSTNYTLPAGSYIIFYDGTNYYFRTDGKLTASITGTAAGTPVVNHGTSDTTFAVTPNTLHIWGTVGSLTLTLATPSDATISNEYRIRFTSGATPTSFNVPASVIWGDNSGTLTVEANKIYEISIEDNLATWESWATS